MYQEFMEKSIFTFQEALAYLISIHGASLYTRPGAEHCRKYKGKAAFDKVTI